MIKKKVLIIGNSDYLISIERILKRKKINYYFVGKNKPSFKLKKNNYIRLNYKNKKKLLIIAKKKKITNIIPDCNDTAYLTASYLANKLNIQGYEPYKISRLLLNKKLFYEFCLKNKIKIPHFQYCKKKLLIIKKISFPILIKPAQSYSGIGIIKINNKKEIDKISNKKKLLFVEFIKGQLYSHSCVVIKNKIINSYFVKEYCLNYPYTVDFSKIVSANPTNLQKKIINEINKIIKLLNIQSGLIHTQYIVKKNRFYLIEITRRLPGDFYSELIKKSYNNNDYLKNYINNFLSEKYSFNLNKFNKSLRKNFFSNEKKEFKKILNPYKIISKKKFYLKKNNTLKFDLSNKKEFILIAKYK